MSPTNKKIIKSKVGFIGGGNMAKAICEGIVRRGAQPATVHKLVTGQNRFRTYFLLSHICFWATYRKFRVLEKIGC